MKAKTKLGLSVGALVAALAISTTSAFAWFTSATNVSTEAFDAQVETATAGLKVGVSSYTATDYKDVVFSNSVTTKAIEDAITAGNKGATIAMTPLTTDALSTFYDVKGTETSAGAALEAGDLVAFQLWFQVDKACDIVLDTGSAVTADETLGLGSMIAPVSWADTELAKYTTKHHAIVKGSNVENDKATAKAADAVRIGFDNGSATKPIWDPNKTASLWDGASSASAEFYNIIMNGATAPVGKSVATLEDQTNLGEAAASILSVDTVTAGETATVGVKVLIWLEGSDADCIDAVMGTKFSTLLKFKAVPKAA